MPQLVGQPCSRCGQPLASLLSGSICPGCGKAVHHACLAPDTEPDTLWHCSRCGGNPSSVPTPAGDDRLALAPSFDTVPEQPFQVPDLRRRRPLWKKAVLGLVLVLLGVGVVWLCYAGFRWSQRNEIERIVRKGFEEKTTQGVTAIHLQRQDDGHYAGTITTTAGEEWDVKAQVLPAGRSRQVRWRARPPVERAERELQKDMEAKLNKKVVSIKLARQADGRLGGTAELQSGEVYDVREPSDDNSPYLFVYEWNQATVEKWVRQYAQDHHNDVLETLTLTRTGPSNYTGTASGKSGLDYRVAIVSAPGAKTQTLTMHPLPESLPRWVTREVERQMKLKVTKMTLTPQPGGHSAGQFVADSGLVYNVRAGTPPAWRKDHRADRPHWKVVLARSSWPTWVKNDLERTHGSKVRSLVFKPRPNGSQVGIARLADGATFWVVLEATKPKRKEGEENLWPDLPDEAPGYRIATRPPR